MLHFFLTIRSLKRKYSQTETSFCCYSFDWSPTHSGRTKARRGCLVTQDTSTHAARWLEHQDAVWAPWSQSNRRMQQREGSRHTRVLLPAIILTARPLISHELAVAIVGSPSSLNSSYCLRSNSKLLSKFSVFAFAARPC